MEMMSQKRALYQIKSLSEDHNVTVATFCRTNMEIGKSIKYFNSQGIKFIPISGHNFEGKFLVKSFFNLLFLLKNELFHIKFQVSKFQLRSNKKAILKIIKEFDYEIIISHYWYSSFFFKDIKNKQIVKVLDLHMMVEEDKELNDNKKFYTKNKGRERKTVYKNLLLQNEVFHYVDLLVPNSLSQVQIIKSNYTENKYYYCPNGQEFSNTVKCLKNCYDENTILFYGSMGGQQNIRAFFLFYKNIWPIILNINKNAKLLIVGHNPPVEIKRLGEETNIEVTGFVNDLFSKISRACCMVLPMDIGHGFRGRVIEVMKAGVPIIGNHNALDCIGITSGINGFVSDDYNKMANYALTMMSNKLARDEISKNAFEFSKKNFSIEHTYGKLSAFLKEINLLI